MGFNKRHLSKEKILSNLSNIDNLLKADSLIMDQWSSYFIEDLRPEQRDLRKALLEDTKFDSKNSYHNHNNFYRISSLSEALINLINDPHLVDVHIVWIYFGFNINEDEAGNLDILSKKAIDSIIEYYDNLAINGRDKKLTEIFS